MREKNQEYCKHSKPIWRHSHCLICVWWNFPGTTAQMERPIKKKVAFQAFQAGSGTHNGFFKHFSNNSKLRFATHKKQSLIMAHRTVSEDYNRHDFGYHTVMSTAWILSEMYNKKNSVWTQRQYDFNMAIVKRKMSEWLCHSTLSQQAPIFHIPNKRWVFHKQNGSLTFILKEAK